MRHFWDTSEDVHLWAVAVADRVSTERYRQLYVRWSERNTQDDRVWAMVKVLSDRVAEKSDIITPA